MITKTNNPKKPIMRPTGKQKPLAIDIFAEKAKQAQADKNALEKEIKETISKHRGDVLDAKKTSNQHHFTLASSFVAGSVAANFLALRGDGLEENIARVAMIFGVAGLVKTVNNHYAIRGAIYNTMLDKINGMASALEGISPKSIKIPSYKALYDEAKSETATTKEQRRKIHRQFNNKVTNWGTNIIAGTALAVFVYKAISTTYENRDFLKGVIKDLAQIETPVEPEILTPPTPHPN